MNNGRSPKIEVVQHSRPTQTTNKNVTQKHRKQQTNKKEAVHFLTKERMGLFLGIVSPSTPFPFPPPPHPSIHLSERERPRARKERKGESVWLKGGGGWGVAKEHTLVVTCHERSEDKLH